MVQSARLRELSAALATSDTAALTRFWAEVARSGAPLVENAPGDSASRLITFLLQSRPDVRALVVTDFAHYLPQAQLQRCVVAAVE